MDPLADLLEGVHARTATFCRAILDPPWSLRIVDDAALALATCLRGHAWIVPDEGEPVFMDTGDVAIVKGPAPYTVSDDPATPPQILVHAGNRLTTPSGHDVTDELRLGPRTNGHRLDGAHTVASGTYSVTHHVTGRLLTALPDVVLVPAADAQSPLLGLLMDEVGRDGPAQQVVLDRLLDIALVATLRAWFDRPDAEPPGWYRAQADDLAGPALRMIHADPARSWTVAALAEQTGCSRATLARRFTTLVGEPPMTYLTSWRMALAADRLRSSTRTVETIAREVGYANAFALSVAFKRLHGISPTQYRTGGHATGADREPSVGGQR